MTKRITQLFAAIAALAALALGGSAIAGAVQGQSEPPGAKTEAAEPNEAAEGNEAADESESEDKGEQATGPQADQAKQAALAATGGGEATSVQKDEAEGDGANEADQSEPGEKGGDDDQEGYQSPAGSAWEVEVTKGSKQLEVYLDKDFKVLDTVPAEQE